ncbi:GHKL domain-containing protein [Bifidobacterium lemurum]|uniref:GHKL domain-containing protein n=1 Tax=Bifidobacterium lemurum TaxID=1603886 RepID=A0A261FQQ7_9BIFI|nr:ATP-binding protein [Bifidobacterium lemurum]OZG61504.1 GHKL domain-containing protein [Bifidobacterium lemurum]QOL35077.1 sensor histidine kinase [Bifidobacterium lemurum]
MTLFPFAYFYPFIVELLCATALFSTHFAWRRSWRLVLIPVAVCVCAPAFTLFLTGLNGGASWRSDRIALYHALCAVVVIALIRCCTRASWLESSIAVVLGYAVQHMASDVATLVWLACGYDIYEGYYSGHGMQRLAIYAVLYCMVYLCVGRHSRIDHEKIRSGAMWIIAGVAVLILVIVAHLALIRQLPESAQAVGYFYDLLCTMLSLCMLLLVSANDRLSTDLALLRQADRLKQEHYELTRETIDLINIKCHDFRKSVATLYAENGAPPSADAVRKVEDSLRVYDAIFQTGSDSLDVILTEKSLYCSAHGITLDCMADGRDLGFLDDADLYSLFGNILDNAIEAVRQLDDGDRRVIDMTVKTVGGLLTIEERNFYRGTLSFQDGLPVTTKEDRRYHGFGMRSIVNQVRQHHGEMNVRADDGVFSLTIVIPLP